MVTVFCVIIQFKDSLSPRKEDGTINDTLNADELAIVKFIEATPGVQISDIMTFTGKSRPTINRYVARLVELSKIERRGSRKTGGYYIL